MFFEQILTFSKHCSFDRKTVLSVLGDYSDRSELEGLEITSDQC